jgi:hypothetical protein
LRSSNPTLTLTSATQRLLGIIGKRGFLSPGPDKYARRGNSVLAV